MKPVNHIKRLLRELQKIWQHGHCVGNAAVWSRLQDVKKAVHELAEAFEQKINNNH